MTNIRKSVYGLYIQDWLDEHTTAQQRLDALLDYYRYLRECDENKETPIPFVAWVEENGYDGAIYACEDEFLDGEYLDEEYVESLIGDDPALWEEYLRDIENHDDDVDKVDTSLLWTYNATNGSHEMYITVGDNKMLAATIRQEGDIWVLRNYFKHNNGIIITSELDADTFCEAQDAARAAILSQVSDKIEYYSKIKLILE